MRMVWMSICKKWTYSVLPNFSYQLNNNMTQTILDVSSFWQHSMFDISWSGRLVIDNCMEEIFLIGCYISLLFEWFTASEYAFASSNIYFSNGSSCFYYLDEEFLQIGIQKNDWFYQSMLGFLQVTFGTYFEKEEGLKWEELFTWKLSR